MGKLRLAVAVAFVVFGAVAAIVTVMGSPPADRAVVAVMVPAFIVPPLVGGLILVRRPENPIGWLFCLVGLGLAATMGVGTLGNSGLLGEHVPAWAPYVAWAGQWLFVLFAIPGGLLIMTFPTGRLPSPRWRLAAGAFTLAALASGTGAAFGRATLEGAGRVVPNPLAVSPDVRPLLLTAGSAGDAALALMLVPIAAAVVVRMRRAVGVERLQLKWFAYSNAMLALVIPASSLLPAPLADFAWGGIVLGFGAALPLAAGIAILRYRLYDIDVVIRRTLVYGAVVAILAGVYVVLVLGLQAGLARVTGGGTLPVAISTLVIAALFGPVRSRVRSVVDRRFYRSRYDAQRTLEAFATRLRDEVELEAVGRTLVDVAGRAVHPTSVGVWLRKPAP